MAAYNRLSVYNASDSRAHAAAGLFFCTAAADCGADSRRPEFPPFVAGIPGANGFCGNSAGSVGRRRARHGAAISRPISARLQNRFRPYRFYEEKNIQAIRCRPVYCTADTMHESNRNPRRQRCRFSFGSWVCSVCVHLWLGWLGSRVVSVLGLGRRRARVQIAVVTLSGNNLRQAVHTHCASVLQAAKLVAALLRAAKVTAGLAESNGSLPPGL